MLFYSNRKAHPFSISDVPIYKSIFHLLQAPPVTVYKPLFFNVSSTILMTAHILLAFLALFSCDTSCDICPENRRFLSLFGFRFVHSEIIKKPHKHWIFQQLCGLPKSGAEGNRTPVRKSIPCSSTIIVSYLTFPLPSGKKHSDGFSSFIIRPHVQSFTCVVSYIIDARVLKCRCLKSDSCH